jgi:DNA-binding Lrp family transcriptional regulator
LIQPAISFTVCFSAPLLPERLEEAVNALLLGSNRFIIAEVPHNIRRILMTRAFVLLNVETGSEDNVLKQLKKISAVEEAYVSYGVYDLVIKAKADTMEELKDAVAHKIRVINQVQSTLTLIMMEE